MKYLSTLAGALALFAAFTLLSAFAGRDSELQTAREQVSRTYRANLAAFREAVTELLETARRYQRHEAGTADARAAYLRCRERYKKLEFLAEYSDPMYIKDHINGPPLPSLERNVPVINILEPEGLQVIDEVLFLEEEADPDELLALCGQLSEKLDRMLLYHRSLVFDDRNIFEAARLALVRMFALGLTGFDAPASLNSLPEARAVLGSLHENMSAYYPALQERRHGLRHTLDSLFRHGSDFLATQGDFDTFDRLAFLQQVVNPLFGALLDAQQALGIAERHTSSERKQSINFLARNMFDADFLNPFFHTQLVEEVCSPESIALGKFLFFDPILSGSNSRACASCHKPAMAFTDGLAKSHALDFKGDVGRNAPTLINSVYADRYFFDMRAEVLEAQFEHVITNSKEFNSSYPEIFAKLEQSAEYVSLFRQAFPNLADTPINRYTVSSALAAYITTLQAFNSPFDKFVRGESASIAPEVRRGFNLFMGKAACGTCHFAPTFAGLVPPLYQESESEVLGVPATPDTLAPVLDPDIGRHGGLILERAAIYRHSFKTMTVRNIEHTAPYMHNGVYRTLEEVMDFYNKGGGAGLGLEVENQTLAPDPLNLTAAEIQDIIAFMKALSDTSGLSAAPKRLPAFDNPKLGKRVIGGEY